MRAAKRPGKRFSSGSQPIIFYDDSDIPWVVKYQNNPQGLRVLVNEWISSPLAKLLGLPTPDVDLIDIPEPLIVANRIPANTSLLNGPLMQAGISFGSQFVDPNFCPPQPSHISNLVNADVLPAMVVFDTWVINADRTNNQGNVLVSPVLPIGSGQFKFHMIDMGFIHSPHWNVSLLTSIRDHPNIYSMNPLLMCYLQGPLAVARFRHYLDRLEGLNVSEIWRIVQSIPPEWKVSDDEMDALYSFLIHRKNLVRSIIQTNNLC